MKKLSNIALDVSKLALEKMKHISTKNSIEKIKGHQNTNTKNMCETIVQIEKKRKELDIKEKELQDLNQNPNKKRKRMDEDKDKKQGQRQGQKQRRVITHYYLLQENILHLFYKYKYKYK
jgi:hypothetical protein